MKIIHKQSGEVINSFPHYYKSPFGYGYLILGFDLKVQFIYAIDTELSVMDLSEVFDVVYPVGECTSCHVVNDMRKFKSIGQKCPACGEVQ